VTGDYSPFWQARDYLSRVGGVEASVFVVHGLNDWNVNTKAFAEWWYRLADRRVPRKIWLHTGGHGPPRGDGPALYKLAENRRFDYWLSGPERDHRGAAVDDPARGRHLSPGGRPARSRGTPREAAPLGAHADRARRPLDPASATQRGPELRRPGPRARHGRRADHRARHRAPEPARLPVAGAHPRRAHQPTVTK
jgi:hypothetical protein